MHLSPDSPDFPTDDGICERLHVLSSFIADNRTVLLDWFQVGLNETYWNIVRSNLKPQSLDQRHDLLATVGQSRLMDAVQEAADFAGLLHDYKSIPEADTPPDPSDLHEKMRELSDILNDADLRPFLQEALEHLEQTAADREDNAFYTVEDAVFKLPAMLRASKLFNDSDLISTFVKLVSIAEKVLAKNS